MSRIVSSRQLELLLDFLGQHRSLALGRVRGKEGSLLSKRLWAECAEILNSDIGGAHKESQEWKKYYNQYKSRVKAKIRGIKQGLKGTGGGPAEQSHLTPLEDRLYGILGSSSSPLTVTHNPLDTLENNRVDGGDADVDRDRDSEGISSSREVDSVQPAEYFILPNENIETMVDHQANNVDIEDPVTQRQQGGAQQQRDNMERPQRRRRRHRSSSPQANKEFEDAGQRLAAIEQSRLEVDREQTDAINRQAGAIEGLVEQVKRFVDIYERKFLCREADRDERFRNIRLSSSSSDENDE